MSEYNENEVELAWYRLRFEGGPKDGCELTWCVPFDDSKQDDVLPTVLTFTYICEDENGIPRKVNLYRYDYKSQNILTGDDGEPLDVITYECVGVSNTTAQPERN